MFKFPKANNGSKFKSSNVQSQPNKIVQKKVVAASPISDDVETKPKVDTSVRSKISNKRKISEFEELSNVSEERPEIISLTSFSPLYDEFGNQTETGKLLDVYVETLKQIDATNQKLYNEIEEKDKDYLKKKNESFKLQITELRQKLSEFNALIKSVSLASNNLNLHNKIYDFSPNEFLEKSFDDDDSRKTKKSELSPIVNKLPSRLNLDIAVTDLLGLPQNASLKYSSTKLWLLAITEYRRLLMTHSRHLLPPTSKPDANESASLLGADKTFRLSLPAFQSMMNDVSINIPKVIPPGVSYDETAQQTTIISVDEAFNNVKSSIEKVDKLLAIVKSEEAKIAVIFDMIAKEIRYSACFDQESPALKAFRGPGTQAIGSKNFFDSVVGEGSYNYDVYKKSPDFATINLSLSDFAYSRDLSNQNKAVLVLEEKERSNISDDIVVGSKYYFDVEDIFTNIVGSRLNLSRITSLQTTVSRLDNDFFNIASNFGLLPIDNSILRSPTTKESDGTEKSNMVFGDSAPWIVSGNPLKFIETAMSLFVNSDGSSKTYNINDSQKTGVNTEEYLFLQMDRGISSLFSLAAREDDIGRIIRSYLFLIIDDISNGSNNVDIDVAFFASLRNMSKMFPKSVDVEKQIANEKISLKFWLTDILRSHFNNSSDWFGETDAVSSQTILATKSSLASVYEDLKGNLSPNYKYIPCKFESSGIFSKVLRENELVKNIVLMYRELKNVFQNFVSRGGTKSAFSGVSFNNLAMIFMTAIIKMVSQFSDNQIVSMAVDDEPAGNAKSAGYGYVKDDTGKVRLIFGADDIQSSLNFLGIHSYDLVLYVNSDLVPHTSKKNEISSYIQKELTELVKISFAILNTLDVLNSNIKSVDAVLKKFNSSSMGFLLSFLNNDPRKLSLFLREPQLMLALSTVEDIYQSFNDFNDDDKQYGEEDNLFTDYVQNSHFYPKMTEIYELLFKDNDEYTSKKGYNKKIMTVGIPQGMFDNLLKKTSLNSKNSKHNDIFKVSIYKTDILNNEIIYRPKIFLFEASRYPARVYSDIKQTRGSDYTEIFNAIPTRNYSLFVDGKTMDSGNPVYWDEKSNSFGNEYSFLSEQEKKQIIENHVTSYVLENYLKVITGLSFDELTFSLDSREIESLVKLNPDPTVLQQTKKAVDISLAKSAAAVTAIKNSKTLSNSLGIGGKNLSASAKPISRPATLNSIKNFKSSVQTTTRVKAQESLLQSRFVNVYPLRVFANDYIKRVIQPKKFDRVFNIIFDPEFEIDYEKTTATSIGAEKLNKLIQERTIIQRINNSNTYVDADKSPQSITLDSYFVVIETHAEKYALNLSVRLDKDQITKTNSMSSDSLKNLVFKKFIENVYKK